MTSIAFLCAHPLKSIGMDIFSNADEDGFKVVSQEELDSDKVEKLLRKEEKKLKQLQSSLPFDFDLLHLQQKLINVLSSLLCAIHANASLAEIHQHLVKILSLTHEISVRTKAAKARLEHNEKMDMHIAQVVQADALKEMQKKQEDASRQYHYYLKQRAHKALLYYFWHMKEQAERKVMRMLSLFNVVKIHIKSALNYLSSFERQAAALSRSRPLPGFKLVIPNLFNSPQRFTLQFKAKLHLLCESLGFLVQEKNQEMVIQAANDAHQKIVLKLTDRGLFIQSDSKSPACIDLLKKIVSHCENDLGHTMQNKIRQEMTKYRDIHLDTSKRLRM